MLFAWKVLEYISGWEGRALRFKQSWFIINSCKASVNMVYVVYGGTGIWCIGGVSSGFSCLSFGKEPCPALNLEYKLDVPVLRGES